MSDIATLVPEPADAELAASALRGLEAALDAKGPVRLRLAGQAGELEVPRSALAALAQVLDGRHAPSCQGSVTDPLPA